MITSLIRLDDNIRNAYMKARAAMEKVELTHGTPIRRGTSLAFKSKLDDVAVERTYDTDTAKSWPVAVEQVVTLILDLRDEYERLYNIVRGYDVAFCIKATCDALEDLADAIRHAASGKEETATESTGEAEGAPSLVEEHPAIKDAYKAAMRAMQEAAGDVENRDGRGRRCALGRIVSDTCELKNLGYSIQYDQNERRETALLILDMVSLEYSELYYRTDSPEDEKYKAASDAIHELRRIVSEHLPKEER